MKMKELEAQSGVPRSAIHFYVREGILPAPAKAARNSARYSEEHVRRLQAIARVKKTGTQLPLPLLKRAAELMDRGVEPDVAIQLERAVLGPNAIDSAVRFANPAELAGAAEVPEALVERLIELEILVPMLGDGPPFDGTDLRMTQTLARLLAGTGLDLEVAIPITRAIRDLSRYEMGLRNQAVAGRDATASAALTLAIQDGVHLIHSYLFYRWRLRDIAELREAEQAGQAPEDAEPHLDEPST